MPILAISAFKILLKLRRLAAENSRWPHPILLRTIGQKARTGIIPGALGAAKLQKHGRRMILPVARFFRQASLATRKGWSPAERTPISAFSGCGGKAGRSSVEKARRSWRVSEGALKEKLSEKEESWANSLVVFSRPMLLTDRWLRMKLAGRMLRFRASPNPIATCRTTGG